MGNFDGAGLCLSPAGRVRDGCSSDSEIHLPRSHSKEMMGIHCPVEQGRHNLTVLAWASMIWSAVSCFFGIKCDGLHFWPNDDSLSTTDNVLVQSEHSSKTIRASKPYPVDGAPKALSTDNFLVFLITELIDVPPRRAVKRAVATCVLGLGFFEVLRNARIAALLSPTSAPRHSPSPVSVATIWADPQRTKRDSRYYLERAAFRRDDRTPERRLHDEALVHGIRAFWVGMTVLRRMVWTVWAVVVVGWASRLLLHSDWGNGP
ncbi:hypothetical protein DFH09DRAFT_1084554 [Mycena vulgaris]|nr:hypothetical protein DFH09DRAFT_1084554 [Mycena vulgaris]